MAMYLGEKPIDIATHPEYSQYTAADWAMAFITVYGGFDGAHHKTWVIDQTARILKGTPVTVIEASWDDGTINYRFTTGEPSPAYLAWRDELEGETYEDGSREFEYDDGIPP